MKVKEFTIRLIVDNNHGPSIVNDAFDNFCGTRTRPNALLSQQLVGEILTREASLAETKAMRLKSVKRSMSHA